MLVLIGGLITGIELIATGALLKVGGHLGQKFLISCGEDEHHSSNVRVKGGKKLAVDNTSGEDVSHVV